MLLIEAGNDQHDPRHARESTMRAMDVRLIETKTHGRVLVRAGNPRRLLAGFHGYAQNAEEMMAELEQIPGSEAWTLAAIQGLHRFYRSRSEVVVSSWMTRQDREAAINDNIEYVRRVIATFAEAETIVFVGFSQGAAMAYRAASTIRCSAVAALGGDLPPDVDGAKLPRVLIGRGAPRCGGGRRARCRSRMDCRVSAAGRGVAAHRLSRFAARSAQRARATSISISCSTASVAEPRLSAARRLRSFSARSSATCAQAWRYCATAAGPSSRSMNVRRSSCRVAGSRSDGAASSAERRARRPAAVTRNTSVLRPVA